MARNLTLLCALLMLSVLAMPSEAAACSYYNTPYNITVVDGYQRPVPNAQVVLYLYGEPCWGSGWQSVSVSTDGNGQIATSMAGVFYGPPQAWAELAANGRRTIGQTYFMASGAGVSGTFMFVPNPDGAISTDGFEYGYSTARLYQSGAYDKPVVIPEGFDPNEQDAGSRREWAQLWLDVNGDPNVIGNGWSQTFLNRLYAEGYDVWLSEPWKTGDNLHEQAAEHAQVVAFASRFQGINKKVALMGYSLGGL
jgi:hypothetical protein